MAAKILTFGNQKGGVGKTTLTNQLAMYIHNKSEYSVLVIDGDYLQESLSSTRKQEKDEWLNSMKQDLEAKGKEWNKSIEKMFGDKYDEQCYTIVTKDTNSILNSIPKYSQDYDFILIDMPGSLIGEGIIKLYMYIDFLFIPLDVSPKDMDASRRFLDMYNTRIKQKREEVNLECNVYGVFNKLKEGSIDFKTRYEQVKEKGIDIPFLENYITETSQLKREDSTVEMIQLDQKLKNPEMIDKFCKEILTLLSNVKN